jgi:hypothetical protein
MGTQKAAIADALAAKRPAGHHPDEIVAMLDAVPDLRPTIEKATDEELAEIFKAFDVRITYDKNRQTLDFAATITSELMPDENDRPEGRSRVSDIAGAGLIPNPATVDGPRTGAVAHRVEESCVLGEPMPPRKAFEPGPTGHPRQIRGSTRPPSSLNDKEGHILRRSS